MRFQVGQTIVRRNIHRNGRIAAVETARVVSDDPQALLTWTAPGSQIMHRTTLDGEPIRKMPLAQRNSIASMLAPSRWRDTGVLMSSRPGAWHSTWWFFES
jgi:hypothetical protein